MDLNVAISLNGSIDIESDGEDWHEDAEKAFEALSDEEKLEFVEEANIDPYDAIELDESEV